MAHFFEPKLKPHVRHDYSVIFRDLCDIDRAGISEETIQILTEPFASP
jgi:hypothetical protein